MKRLPHSDRRRRAWDIRHDFILGLVLLILGGVNPALSQVNLSSPISDEKLLEKVVRQTKSWETVTCVVTSTTNQFDKGAGHPTTSFRLKRAYSESSRGGRKLGISRVIEGGERDATEDITDGTKCAQLRFGDTSASGRITSVNIRRTFGTEATTGYNESPVPLMYNYVGLQPLHEALSSAKSLPSSSVMDRRCRVFQFSGVKGGQLQDLVYHIDVEYGIPLKVEAYRATTVPTGNPSWIWEASSIKKEADFYYTDLSNYVYFGPNPTLVDRSPSMTIDYSVDQIRFNNPIADSEFWFRLGPNVHVIDSVAGKFYDTPGKVPALPIASSTPPIRVEGFSAWRPFSILLVAVGLLILSGLVIRRYRRAI